MLGRFLLREAPVLPVYAGEIPRDLPSMDFGFSRVCGGDSVAFQCLHKKILFFLCTWGGSNNERGAALPNRFYGGDFGFLFLCHSATSFFPRMYGRFLSEIAVGFSPVPIWRRGSRTQNLPRLYCRRTGNRNTLSGRVLGIVCGRFPQWHIL